MKKKKNAKYFLLRNHHFNTNRLWLANHYGHIKKIFINNENKLDSALPCVIWVGFWNWRLLNYNNSKSDQNFFLNNAIFQIQFVTIVIYVQNIYNYLKFKLCIYCIFKIKLQKITIQSIKKISQITFFLKEKNIIYMH